MSKRVSTTTEHREERPHVSDLAIGLLESRLTHIPFLDTLGGAELERLYRRQWRDRTKVRTRTAA